MKGARGPSQISPSAAQGRGTDEGRRSWGEKTTDSKSLGGKNALPSRSLKYIPHLIVRLSSKKKKPEKDSKRKPT